MRVFNVSHHKCGTTSIHNALEILGFRSHHWERPNRLLWRHLKGNLEKERLFKEDNSAFNDLPMTLMYRELKRLYPDDKFLFVRRDRGSWLRSLRAHVQANWEEAIPVHTAVYGYPLKASNFDEAACLRAYDRICHDIMTFFAGDRNFLLLEFSDLAWDPICRFLGKPVPNCPFPWEKRTIQE